MIGFLLRLPLAVVGAITDRVLGPAEPFEYKYSTTPPGEDELQWDQD